MDVVCTHGAGLDVQQKTVMACRVPPDPTGQQADGIMALSSHVGRCPAICWPCRTGWPRWA
jgi:hypothetical protein